MKQLNEHFYNMIIVAKQTDNNNTYTTVCNSKVNICCSGNMITN